MALIVDVPLNTMLADLDESLRALLVRELAKHGFDGVEVAFDAPAEDWSAKLSAPTVNLFLYDLRESTEHRQRTVDQRRANGGGAVERRPPMLLDCSYAVTVWTQTVEDEHRLLSQLLAILFSLPRLPADILSGRLSNGQQRYPIFAKIGQGKGEGKADFWNAVGGRYKVSLDYVVTLSCEAGVTYERGPEVRDLSVRLAELDGAPGRVTELHRLGGRVTDPDGAPTADAWVTLPDLGRWASSDADGRFQLLRVPAGEHRVVARTREGGETEATYSVPGGPADIVMGAKRKPASRK